MSDGRTYIDIAYSKEEAIAKRDVYAGKLAETGVAGAWLAGFDRIGRNTYRIYVTQGQIVPGQRKPQQQQARAAHRRHANRSKKR